MSLHFSIVLEWGWGGGGSSTLFTNRMTDLVERGGMLIDFVYQQNEILAMFVCLLTSMEPCLYHDNNYSPNSFAVKVQFSFHVQQLQPNLVPPIDLKPSKI